MKHRNIVLLLLLSLASCSERPAATPVVARPPIATSQVPAGITPNEAVAMVSGLPEAKAWGKFISEKTNGVARAAMMVLPQQPETREGKYYWSVNFYESQPTHLHRWQTFMVRLDGKEILVDDVTSGDYWSMAEWRKNEKPMDRVRDTTAQ